MYESLRTVRAVEQAFKAGRYVYFRANRAGIHGGWTRIGNKGRNYIKWLLLVGDMRTRA